MSPLPDPAPTLLFSINTSSSSGWALQTGAKAGTRTELRFHVERKHRRFIFDVLSQFIIDRGTWKLVLAQIRFN